MIILGLQNRIKTFSISQQLYPVQHFKTSNSCLFNFKRPGSAHIESQFQQVSYGKSHRSSSSKRKLFKSAKQIQTGEKKRSNSFKNIGSVNKKLFLDSKKQFQIPTKKSGRYNEGVTIMNEKKAIVEDIIGRLRNKGSMRMQVKQELILNDRKQKRNVVADDDNQNNTEPKLNLQEIIRTQIEKKVPPYQQILKMKEVIEQKSVNLSQFQIQLNNKINWISTKMEEFQQRENQIKIRQESIDKKAQLLEMGMLRKIEEQDRTHQLKLNKQFNDNLNQLNKMNQASRVKTQPIDNQSRDDKTLVREMNQISKKQIKTETMSRQQFKPVNHRKQKLQSQKSNQSQIVSFDSIQEIEVVGMNPQTVKKDLLRLTLKNHQPQRQKSTLNCNNSNSNNNNKSSYKTKQQQRNLKQSHLSKQQQKQHINYPNEKLKYSDKNLKQSDKNLKQSDKNLKQSDQKHQVVTFLKNIKRINNLLYFIGEITTHFNTNMRRIKKYEFKMTSLYLLKYFYDKFRNIEKTYKILVDRKDIPLDVYQFRMEQNKSIKQSYVKWKAYVNKKLSFPNKQIEGYMDEESPKLCCENRKFFNRYLFPQAKKIVEFYYNDTRGEWTEHKVNLCYFRMMMAVFIIFEIEFNRVVIDTEGNEHPNYMIDEIDNFNQSQLQQKMTEAYQLFQELFYNEPQ